MKRSEFLATILGTPLTVKAIDEMSQADRKPVLLAFECQQALSADIVKHLRVKLEEKLKPHGIDFIILHGGMTVKAIA